MIIDFHVHLFPDAMAANALEQLQHRAGNIRPFTDGTSMNTLQHTIKNHVDYTVVLNIATKAGNQKKVNDFAASINEKYNIIAFGSVHPEAPDIMEELERIKEMGLKGIKFHPDYQSFYVNEARMYPIYEKIAELGLITVFHSGIDIGIFEPVHCTPKRLKSILKYFHGAPVVAAHFGGYLMWNDVEQYLIGEDVYLDTSFSYSRMPPFQASRIVEKHGAEKILYGSDLPWSDEGDEKRFIEALDVDNEKRALIMGGNAKRLLKM